MQTYWETISSYEVAFHVTNDKSRESECDLLCHDKRRQKDINHRTQFPRLEFTSKFITDKIDTESTAQFDPNRCSMSTCFLFQWIMIFFSIHPFPHTFCSLFHGSYWIPSFFSSSQNVIKMKGFPRWNIQEINNQNERYKKICGVFSFSVYPRKERRNRVSSAVCGKKAAWTLDPGSKMRSFLAFQLLQYLAN